jgi:TM2 domain-containing membrane protein YozV
MDSPQGSYIPPPPPPPGGGYSPPGGGSDKLIYPSNPARDPILVLVLNLLLFGSVGYFLLGQTIKGIIASILWVVLLFTTCGVGTGIVAILGAVDGYLQAQQLQAGHPVAQFSFFQDHR